MSMEVHNLKKKINKNDRLTVGPLGGNRYRGSYSPLNENKSSWYLKIFTVFREVFFSGEPRGILNGKRTIWRMEPLKPERLPTHDRTL